MAGEREHAILAAKQKKLKVAGEKWEAARGRRIVKEAKAFWSGINAVYAEESYHSFAISSPGVVYRAIGEPSGAVASVKLEGGKTYRLPRSIITALQDERKRQIEVEAEQRPQTASERKEAERRLEERQQNPLLSLNDPNQSDNPIVQGTPTLADAFNFNVHAASAGLQQQREKSAQMGLWDPLTRPPKRPRTCSRASCGISSISATQRPAWYAQRGHYSRSKLRLRQFD